MAGVAFPNGAEQFLVVVDLEFRVHAPLHQDSGPAERQGLLDLPEDGLIGQDIALVVTGPPVEVAEGATGDTDIGVVDVPVHQEGDHPVRMKPAAHPVGGLAQLLKFTGLQ